MRKLLYIDSSYTLSQIRARGLDQVLKVRFLDEYFNCVWSAHPVDTHPLSDPDIASVGAPVFERLSEDHVFVRGRYGRFSALTSIAPLNAILALVSFTRTLIKLVRRERIPVIRAGDPLMNGLIGLLVARRTGAKLIIRVNSVNDRIRKDTGTPIMPNFLRSGRLESFIERQVLSRADGIIAQGKVYADFAIRNGAASDKTKIIRVGNLIDKRHLVEPLERSLPEDGDLSHILTSRPWMVYVGRLTEVKRPEDCYDVFRILAKEHRDVGLLMIGDGQLRDTILRRAEIDGLSNRVLLLGNIDQEKIAAILVLCTLALSPLTGRSLAEVAFAALPVVAYDLDWQSEIIEHSVTGYLAPEGSISQMAEYASMLLKDEPSRRQLGKAVRQRAFQLLDPEQQTRNEREVYADALRDD